ncbi:hypothetical protein BMT55_03410 [Listeria newyorkensis]|uniref:DUF3885 domain-containing protein n=1 Tax=Listeria newyorkensis TaxID=1497681 RepID=A0ABX4XQF0_9LIST|nr:MULTISPECIES: DUF3885 domain-containing protein [Listeria]KGL41318.1 hypothetical protein EP56_12105 [Listeriaceae bacterium FSL A5-0209]KGL44654.1 hypothetical protein EP58_04035 [Listeria newyorkensis]PNP93829.1 hypothetical protein BMT55_03410 [Listeria newyorkensis]RQW67332.1 DUF3885 domain-containing protein [Listeria sp. SHR_NRA_18]WAO22451.1 DUF3885 domain-containing protein [Listeria newyorkensis]
MSKSFETYFSHNFGKLQLEPPLFYHAPVGIRFELGDPAEMDEEIYFKRVNYRAKRLFQEIFEPSDLIYLVVDKDTDSIRRYLKNKNLKYSLSMDSNSRIILKCKIEDLRCIRMLQAILNVDLIRKPRLRGQCWFINTRTNIIFHAYDDRGLDIVGNEASLLRSLYTQYQDWILDYDRAQIDHYFIE